ncbi:MAG: ACT domain-containing protein [Myxococcota bacterium]|jgi:[protein-PII] uridylyltransferase|nr:ACT domain-containing protein [Myxococcota bacterium]
MGDIEAFLDFVKSMPATYTQVFTPQETEEHARIVAERGSRPSHAALWRTLPSGLSIFCVVASDRPGVVALISAAFVAHQLDVCSAQIYSRKRRDGAAEAVDFFWVHGSGSSALSIAKRHRACARTIQEFLGRSSEPELAESSSRLLRAPEVSASVEILQRTVDGREWELCVEVADRPGLLHAIARTLYRQGLEIVHSDVRTSAGIARDRFTISPVSGRRLEEAAAERLKRALLAAIAELSLKALAQAR